MDSLKNNDGLFEIIAKTDIGKIRSTNEDSITSLVIRSHNLNSELDLAILVVADGMGGHEAGGYASALASKKFVESVIKNIYEISDHDGIFDFENILLTAIRYANNEVFRFSKSKNSKMGTTLVGAIIYKKRAHIVNIGDSRAYIVQPNKSLLQITKDHTVAQEMVDAGLIPKEHIKIHPKRHMLTRAIGIDMNIEPDIFTTEINNNILLLCSDGLYGIVEEEDIIKNIGNNIVKSAENLIIKANELGGTDNISIIVAKSN